MCDLVNQLLAVKAISDKDMEKLKSDKYLFYDPLVLMDLRHKQAKRISKRAPKCPQPKTVDIESSRILKEEEQRKRMKMRELSIVNRKLDEFKKEIELSKKRFEKEAKMWETSFKFKKKKSSVKIPLSANNRKTAEAAHQKALQSFKHSTTQMSDEKNIQYCEIQKLEQHNSLCPEKTDMIIKIPEHRYSDNHQTGYLENLSEGPNCTSNLPCLLTSPTISAEVPNSVDNVSKTEDSISYSETVSEAANFTSMLHSVPDKIVNYECDLLMCRTKKEENNCKSDVDVGGMQVIMVQQKVETSEVSSNKEVNVSFENEQNLSSQSNIKMSNDNTVDLRKDIHELKAAEIQVSESEISSKKGRTLEDQGEEQCTHLISDAVTVLRNSSKNGLAGVFMSTLVKQNTQINCKKNSLTGKKRKGNTVSVNGKTENNREGSQVDILHKYWQLWKDHTFSEMQKNKVDRLMSALEEFRKNDQLEQREQQRDGCHSAGPMLENQNNTEDLSNTTTYNKRESIKKPIRCKSMPATSNVTSLQVSTRRGRERNRKQQDMTDHIENKVRELSAERHKREAALSQEKEEMHIKPYGKVPFWVLQPTRLIATESLRRTQERKEAIKLRLEAKKLQQEQEAAAERMRLEAERERLRALHEMVWTQYRQKVSRRLLLDPLRALVAESRRKQAEATALASYLLLRKCWKAWRQITFEKLNVLSEVVRRIRMRRAFQAFLEIRADSKRKHQVAEDFYDVWILKSWAFIRWRTFVGEQLVQEATAMQMALQHYNSTLLHHYFRQWYKVRDEKKRRERLEAWRTRVREVLPDFMPPEID